MRKRKEKRLNRVIALVASLALAIGLVPAPAFAAGGQMLAVGTADLASADMVAANGGEGTVETTLDPTGTYYTQIKADPWTYCDVGKGAHITLDDKAVLQLVKGDLLESWSAIAVGCFADAGDCASLLTGNFQGYFMTDSPKHDCFGNIQKVLTGKSANKGKAGKNNLWGTGVKVASSLSEVRQIMGNQIAAQASKDGMKAEQILARGPVPENEHNGCALKELKDSTQNQTVVYSIATSYNDEGVYNSFGICFYDFQPRPIQEEGLQYKHAAEGYDSVKDAAEAGVKGVTYTFDSTQDSPNSVAARNESSSPMSQTITTSESISANVTNNFSKSSTYTYGQSVGLSTTWSMGQSIRGALSESNVSTSITASLNFNFSEAYTTTEGTSWSTDDTKSTTYNTGTTVAPQTASLLTSSTSNATIAEDYDTPVMISYKVAIFSLTGYIEKHKAFNMWGSFLNIVGGDSSTGVSANENLRLRVVDNQQTGRNDATSGGVVHRYYHKNMEGDIYDTTDVGVDWHGGLLASNSSMKQAVDYQTKNIPMVSCGCDYQVKYQTETSVAGEFQPLYLPRKFVLEKGEGEYQLAPGQKLNLTKQLEVACLNKNDVPYYGFNETDGQWSVCDDNGVPCASDAIGLSTDGVGNQIVTASSPGEAYVIWKPKDGVEYGSTDETGVVTAATADIEWPLVKVVVQAEAFEGSVEVSGDFTGCVGDEGVNLNDCLKVKVFDKNGKQVRVPVVWDQRELDGIEVSENGDIVMTKAGDYGVMAIVKNTGSGADDVRSAWFPITVRPERTPVKAEFDPSVTGDNVIELDATNATHVFDLKSYIRAYDQYGDPWTGALEGLSYELSAEDEEDADGIHIEDGDDLHITDDGEFKVVPKLEGSYGSDSEPAAPMRFSVAGDPETITVEYVDASGESMGTQECIDIATLSDDEVNQLAPGWYAVQGKVTSKINSQVLDGEVNLILCDGAEWSLYEMSVFRGHLNIWGQAGGTGTMSTLSDALYVLEGSATMNGGVIKTQVGPGARIAGDQSFTLNNGTIVSGGTGVENSGLFVLNGGTVEAETYGVDCFTTYQLGRFTANGGTVIGGSLSVIGMVENTVAGTGWDNVEGTGDGTPIEANPQGQSVSSFKKVQFLEPEALSITIEASPAEGGTFMGDGIYEKGGFAILGAFANEGYEFVNWTENGEEISKDVAFVFRFAESHNLTANFKKTASAESVPMYRLYNPNSGEHFYTGNFDECEEVVAAGWNYEGIGWYAPTDQSIPVFRLYNQYGGEHHYTLDPIERDTLVGAGWIDEGIGWYSDPGEGVALLREYNPNAFACNHNYTTDKDEHDSLIALGWVDEGKAWFAVAAGK